EQESHNATSEESASGGDAPHAVIGRGEGLRHMVCVVIFEDENDHFHGNAPRYNSSTRSTGKAKIVAPPTVTGTGAGIGNGEPSSGSVRYSMRWRQASSSVLIAASACPSRKPINSVALRRPRNPPALAKNTTCRLSFSSARVAVSW